MSHCQGTCWQVPPQTCSWAFLDVLVLQLGHLYPCLMPSQLHLVALLSSPESRQMGYCWQSATAIVMTMLAFPAIEPVPQVTPLHCITEIWPYRTSLFARKVYALTSCIDCLKNCILSYRKRLFPEWLRFLQGLRPRHLNPMLIPQCLSHL